MDLKHRHASAEQEVQHARTLHLDLVGPINAAQAEVERLSTQISHVERLIERVRAGYEYWGDKREFDETAAEAFGWCSWQELSDVPAPGTILGHDDANIRLPVSVQNRYAQAVSTRLFDGFEICSCFEPSDWDFNTVLQPSEIEISEDPEGTTHYLFGTIQSVFAGDRPIFLIASWEKR